MGEREDFEAAERLVREAHRRAEEAAQAAAQSVPPNGWAAPGPPPQPDFNALFALLETVRGTLPPDLARQLADALRELLLALRAILDYSIDRLDPSTPPEPQVEDIPIR